MLLGSVRTIVQAQMTETNDELMEQCVMDDEE